MKIRHLLSVLLLCASAVRAEFPEYPPLLLTLGISDRGRFSQVTRAALVIVRQSRRRDGPLGR